MKSSQYRSIQCHVYSRFDKFEYISKSYKASWVQSGPPGLNGNENLIPVLDICTSVISCGNAGQISVRVFGPKIYLVLHDDDDDDDDDD